MHELDADTDDRLHLWHNVRFGLHRSHSRRLCLSGELSLRHCHRFRLRLCHYYELCVRFRLWHRHELCLLHQLRPKNDQCYSLRQETPPRVTSDASSLTSEASCSDTLFTNTRTTDACFRNLIALHGKLFLGLFREGSLSWHTLYCSVRTALALRTDLYPSNMAATTHLGQG